jgi:hypothetical protein
MCRMLCESRSESGIERTTCSTGTGDRKNTDTPISSLLNAPRYDSSVKPDTQAVCSSSTDTAAMARRPSKHGK